MSPRQRGDLTFALIVAFCLIVAAGYAIAAIHLWRAIGQ